MNNIYQPYTYFIVCKPTGQVYYGVSYRRGCNPVDFWKRYFTSSKVVHAAIHQYGKDAFYTQIRKTFTDGISALNWENKVLRRCRVRGKVAWMNQMEGYQNNVNFYRSKKVTSARNKASTWVTNGKEEHYTLTPNDWLSVGFTLGRIPTSNATKQKMSRSAGSTVHTAEWRQHLRDNNAGGRATAKKVDQYDANMVFIKRWKSIREASIALGVSNTYKGKIQGNGNITVSAKLMKRKAYGFHWRYVSDDYPVDSC